MLDAVVISDIHLGSDNCQAEALVDFLEQVRDGDSRPAGSSSTATCSTRSTSAGSKAALEGALAPPQALRRDRDHLDQRQPRRPGRDRLAPARRRGPGRVRGRERRPERSCSCTATGSTSSSTATRHDLAGRPGVPLPPVDRPVRTRSPSWRSRGSKTFLRCARKIEDDVASSTPAEAGCDAVCCGHTHLAGRGTTGPVHYFNSGCWTETPCHYLTLSGRRRRGTAVRRRSWPTEPVGYLASRAGPSTYGSADRPASSGRSAARSRPRAPYTTAYITKHTYGRPPARGRRRPCTTSGSAR